MVQLCQGLSLTSPTELPDPGDGDGTILQKLCNYLSTQDSIPEDLNVQHHWQDNLISHTHHNKVASCRMPICVTTEWNFIVLIQHHTWKETMDTTTATGTQVAEKARALDALEQHLSGIPTPPPPPPSSSSPPPPSPSLSSSCCHTYRMLIINTLLKTKKFSVACLNTQHYIWVGLLPTNEANI